MATYEERLTAVERDNEEIKRKIELHTTAIGGMVTKAMFERMIEKNDAILKMLITHDEFTNRQLAQFREKVEVDIEGKIVGLQTEMRQRFAEQDGKITALDGKVVGLQTEMRQRFEAIDRRFVSIDERFVSIDKRFEAMDRRFEAMDKRFVSINERFEAMDRRFDRLEGLLAQVIERLPK